MGALHWFCDWPRTTEEEEEVGGNEKVSSLRSGLDSLAKGTNNMNHEGKTDG
jgi:hypothetical protein